MMNKRKLFREDLNLMSLKMIRNQLYIKKSSFCVYSLLLRSKNKCDAKNIRGTSNYSNYCINKNPWLYISCSNMLYSSKYRLYSYKTEKYQKNSNFDVFFNFSFDKGRLKSFVLWFLRTYGQNKTIGLLEQLKEIGFSYATKAGISLGIDDLKTPPQKNDLLIKAEQETKESIIQYKRAEITGIERIQKFMDTWHQTSENLKKEVVRYFESTDILNPVYMMAFSGARGNLSQVRQLVGMRGLMSDPQGQIINFPIQSHFREGLTLTEYIISTYGARKGIVDTALRTANAGYLTRRLVDVAQHVIVSEFDCGTKRGIVVFEMKEGPKTIYSLQNRLIGRVLAKDVEIKNQKMAFRNDEISEDLAISLSKLTKKIFIRSPLTCQTQKFVCQLCYGWSLSTNRLVSIGETVGVIAAQSIGEPGTQLTMRTFHTGGVFSGGISDQIMAHSDGIVEYNVPITGICVRTLQGEIAFLTKSSGSMVLKTSISVNRKEGVSELSVPSNQIFHIPPYTLLFARNGQKVFKRQIIAQLTSSSTRTKQRSDDEQILYSDYEGETYFSYIDIFEKSDKFEDKTFEVWKWGYFWVLSGKVYQFPIESYLFPQPGDFIDRNAILNRISWMLPESCFLDTNFNFRNFKSRKPNSKIEKNISNSFFYTNSCIPILEKNWNKSRKSNISSINHRYANLYKKMITSHRFSSFHFSRLASFTFFSTIRSPDALRKGSEIVRKKSIRNSQTEAKERRKFRQKTLQNNQKKSDFIFHYSKVLNQKNLFPSFSLSYNHRILNYSYFSQRQKWVLDLFSKRPVNDFSYQQSNNELEKRKSKRSKPPVQVYRQIDSTLLIRSIKNSNIDLKNKRFNSSLFSIYHYPFQQFLKSEQSIHKKTYLFYKTRKKTFLKFRIFLYDHLQNEIFYKKTIRSQMKSIFKKLTFQKKNCSMNPLENSHAYKTDTGRIGMDIGNPYFRFSRFFYNHKDKDVSHFVLNSSNFFSEIQKNKNLTKPKKHSIIGQTNMHKSKNTMIQKNVLSLEIKNLFFKDLNYNFMFRFSQQLLNIRPETVDQMFFFNSFNEFYDKNKCRQNTYEWSPKSTVFLKWLPSEFQTKHSGIFILSSLFFNTHYSCGFDPSIIDSSLHVLKKRDPAQSDLLLEIDNFQLSYSFKTIISSSFFGISKIKIYYLNKTQTDTLQGNKLPDFDFQDWVKKLNVNKKKINSLGLNTLPISNLSFQTKKSKDQKIMDVQSSIYNYTEIFEKRFKNLSNIFGFYKFQDHFYPMYKKWFLIAIFKNKKDKTDIFLKNRNYKKQNYKIFTTQKYDFLLLEKLFKNDFSYNFVRKHQFDTNKFVFTNKMNLFRQMNLFYVFPINENDKFIQNGSSSIKKSLKDKIIVSYPSEPTKFQKSIYFVTSNMKHSKIMGFDNRKYSYKSNLSIKDKYLFLNHSSMVHKPENDYLVNQKSNRSYYSILYTTNPFMTRLKFLIFHPIFNHENSSFEFQKYHKFFVQKHLSLFQKTQDTLKPLYQYRNKNSNVVLKQIKSLNLIPKSKLSVNCYELFWLPQESYFLNLSKISWFHSKSKETFLNQSFLYFLIHSNMSIFDVLNRQGLKKPFCSNLNGILKISVKKINNFDKNVLKSQIKPFFQDFEKTQFSNFLFKNKKHLKDSNLFYISLKEKLLSIFIKKWESVVQKSYKNDWNFKVLKKSEKFKDINCFTFSKSIILTSLKKLHIQTSFLIPFFLVNDHANLNNNPKQSKIKPLNAQIAALLLSLSLQKQNKKHVANHKKENSQIDRESVSIQIQQGWVYLSIQDKSLHISKSIDGDNKHNSKQRTRHLYQKFSGIENHHSFFHLGKTIINDVVFENHRVYTQRILLNSVQTDKNIQVNSFKISSIVPNQKSRFGNIELNEKFHIKNYDHLLLTEDSSVIALLIQPMHHKILPNPHFYKKKMYCSRKNRHYPFFSMLLKKHFHSYLLNKQISDKKILSLYPGLDFKVSSNFKTYFLEKKKNQKMLTSGFWNFKKSKKFISFIKPKKSLNKEIKVNLNSFYIKSFTDQKINSFAKAKENVYFSYYPLNFFSLKLDLLNSEHPSYPFNHSYIELNRFNNPIFSFKRPFLSLNQKILNEFLLEKNQTKQSLKNLSNPSYSISNISFHPIQTNKFQELSFVSSLEFISISYQGPSFKVFLTENMSSFANQKLSTKFITNQFLNNCSSSLISNFPIFKNQFLLTSMNQLLSCKYCGLTSFFSPLKGEILPYKKESWLSQNQKILILTKSDLFSIYIHGTFYPENSSIDSVFTKNTRYISYKNIFKTKEFEIKQYNNFQKRKDEFKTFLNQFHESFLTTESILRKKYDFPVFKPANVLIQYQNKLYKINGLRIGFVSPYHKLRIGSFLLYGDVVYPGYSIHKAGQIVHLSSTKVTFRYAQGISASPRGILHTYNGDFVNKNDPIITLPFQTLKTGDIVQGIPKVEQYFEARTTKAGRLFIDSLPNLLYGLFERYRSILPLEKAVRQSLLKIQQIVMNGVQRVYRSQGVGIVDKHLEVIVRQMTSKVEITNAGQSGFFPGERFDIEFIEYVNKFLKIKVVYQPIVLGITRASLEVESFLSAASFQQTTKILSKAAITRKKDFLRGLKENLIVVNLIPAGTGYLVYLNDLQISKQKCLKESI